jgi:hypothetical protein
MEGETMKLLAFGLVALVGAANAAAAAPLPKTLPKTGTVKHAAYTICRAAAAIDLGAVGSNSSADCTGIVRTPDRAQPLDNLALHCLEESNARKAGYKFTGSCVETDADGDKLYLTYEGAESGPVEVLGGTGKFKGITGKGQWRVADAPGNTATLFAFTLDYDFTWSFD